MQPAILPENEADRLAALYRYQILDTAAESVYDDITELAMHICNTPVAAIALIDKDREWYKSRIGVSDEQAGRDISFCAHTILGKDLLVIPDTLKDVRFFDNPYVTDEPPLRFYAAAPLITPDGYVLGTLCVMDHVPRELSVEQQGMLKLLAHQVVSLLEQRKAHLELDVTDLSRQHPGAARKLEEERFSGLISQVPAIICEVEYPSCRFTFVSEYAETLLGYPVADWLSNPDFLSDHIHPDDRDKAIKLCLDSTERGEDHELEYRMLTRDGTYLWLHDKVQVIINDNAQPAGMRGVMINITERKRIEAERERLFNILEASLNEVYTFNTETLRFEYVNASAIHNLGYTSDQLRTMTPIDLKPEINDASFREIIGPLLRHEKEKHVFYTVHRRADASLYPVEVHLQLVELAGKRVFLAIILDITERKRMEEALREQEHSVSILMDNLPGMAYRCLNDRDWTMQFTSSGARSLTGYEPGQFTRGEIKYNDLIHPEDRERIWDEVQAAVSQRQHFKFEYRIRTAGGAEKWVWEQGCGLFNKEGELQVLEGFITDITERVRAQKGQSMLANVVEQTDDAVLITNAEGIIEYVNPAFERMTGYSSAEAIGHKPNLAKSGLHDEGFYQRLWQTIKGGEPFREVFINKRKNGEIFYEQKTITPLMDEHGKIARFVSTAKDITESKQHEVALRTSEAQLSNAMKMVKAGHWGYDVDKNLFTFNDHFYALFRTTAEAVGGYTMSAEEYAHKFVHPDDLDVVEKEVRAAIETTDPNYTRELEHKIIYADGAVGYMAVRIFIIKDEKGRTIKTYGVNQDITQRKRTEERLALLNFALNHAHESVYLIDETARFLNVNDEACRALGYTREELLNMNLIEINPDFSMKQWRKILDEIKQKDSIILETRHQCKDGHIFPVEVNANYFEYNGQGYIMKLVRDITNRKRTEEKIKRLNRVFKMLSAINTLIVHVHDRQVLLNEACRIAVEDGGFRMAWIGLLPPGEKVVVPQAWAGHEEGFLQYVHVSTEKNGLGKDCVCSQAIQLKKPIIQNNFLNNGSAYPWIEEALARGYRSKVGLPLIVAGEAVGVMSLYAAEPEFFDEEELKLLMELAYDISYALQNIAQEEQLDYLASYDPLTGLANRTLFYEHLNAVLERAGQNRKKVALLICDLKQFRHINSVYGRAAGDRELQETARRVQA